MSLIALGRLFGRVFHALSFLLIVFLGAGMLGLTVLASFGVVPWLTLPLTFGTTDMPQAGMYLQIGLTVILSALMFFAPSNGRIMALEKSHRDFRITMDDVARAYHICHGADRAGIFTLSSEFDAMRERITYLRDHPDLGMLETDVLTVAAQMSQQARHLADVYSDEKIARAKEFLRQRQQEAETQQARIVEALHACREIRDWVREVEQEESTVANQLAHLDRQLQAALPLLGYAYEREEPDSNVVPMPTAKPAAE